MACQQLSFQVNSELKALDQVLANFSRLHQPSIPTKDWLQCQLALAEGFTNAVRHAHQGLPPEVPIQIEISIEPQAVEIRIWDYGPPFNLEDFLKQQGRARGHGADTGASPLHDKQMSEHGQGLIILGKISTHLSYTRTQDNRNCLHIVKQISDSTVSYHL